MYSIDMLLPLKLAVTNAFTFKKPTVSVDSLWGEGGGGGWRRGEFAAASSPVRFSS